MTYNCPTCKEETIAFRNGTAWWNEDKQTWELSDDLETLVLCGDCGGEMEETA